LTYDEEVEALNQGEEINQKHRNISEIEKITPSNNSVMCYQFNIIYAKFLDELGIHFESHYRYGKNEDSYGDEHVEMHFRVGDFIVFADSVESMYKGDLAYAKINKTLRSLRCLNKNEETRMKFIEIVSRLYSEIAILENDVLDKEEKLSDYLEKSEKLKIDDKIKIIANEISKKKLTGVDAISYLIYLSKIFFSPQELSENLMINIIALKEENTRARLACIISYDEKNVHEQSSKYFLFIPNKGTFDITFESIKKNFDNGIFNYIEGDKRVLPGIPRDNGSSK